MALKGSNKTEYQREYMRRKRSNRESSKIMGLTEKYPHILYALTDHRRPMLEFISHDLNRKGLGGKVWYGVGGPDFELIGELLECTG